MNAIKTYFKELFGGFFSLCVGMKVTLYYFITTLKTRITQQYPDNRSRLELAERFRGMLVLDHDANNQNKCTGCTMCEMACPNGTIKIVTDTEELPEGKKRKKLDKYVYDLGMCTFCGQCVEACPQDAIRMINAFEHSVYDRSRFVLTLNKPGSKLKEKE